MSLRSLLKAATLLKPETTDTSAAAAYAPGPTPEAFGAVGDGTTDDTAALLLWLAFSGKTISLRPDATYVCRRQLSFSTQGQVLRGNGGTIKRPAQVVTTTTTTIVANTTSTIALASTAGLQVGDEIVVEQGGTYGGKRTIASISGNNVTITGGTTFDVSLSGTTNVRTAFFQIRITGADVLIDGARFDGNYANWSWGRWQNMCAVASSPGSDNGKVINCHFFNQYGDAASPGDTRNFTFAFNTVENCKGRGISWAGANSPLSVGGRCLFNRFDNCDGDTAVAASDGFGCIQVSSYTSDLLIEGNYCTNSKTGIGALNSTDNSDITIRGNTIRTMTTAAIEGSNGANGSSASNVLIEGNRFYDAVAVIDNQSSSGSSTFPSRWIIQGNLFSNTAVTGNFSEHTLIEANTFTGGGSTFDYIAVNGVKKMSIIGNDFDGGRYAMTIGTSIDTLSIKNNTILNPGIRGINLFATTAAGVNSISGNTIVNETAGTFTDGISIATGCDKISIKNNDIKIAGGTAGITTQGAYAVIMGNTVRKGAASHAIRPGGSSANNWIGYNHTDLAISDGGTTNTLVGNVVIT